MSKVLSFFFSFVTVMSFAQDGFIKAYDFDLPNAFFSSMVIKNDTLVLSGLAFSEDAPSKQGFLFAKVDTNGQLLNYQITYDDLGDDFARQQRVPTGLAKLSDNSGYIATGAIFLRDTDYLMKLDNNGNLVFLKEYKDSLTLTDIFTEVIELEDGFLIFGYSSLLDFNIDVFVMKVDKMGNPIWKKWYGKVNRRETFGSVVKVNNNEYILGMPSSTPMSPSSIPHLNQSVTNIICIDSTGNQKWIWENEEVSWEEVGMQSINITNEGYLAYIAFTLDYDDEFNQFIRKMKFIKRDTVNFEKFFEKSVGVFSSANLFHNSLQTSDGGWLAIGNYDLPNDQKIEGTAWTYKLNIEGDSLWSRHDTLFASVLGVPSPGHRLFSAVELPSGSIIATGDLKTSFDEPKWYGLLIKMDKNGCIDGTNCNPVNVLDFIEFESDIKIYPNPTDNILKIDFQNPTKARTQFLLFDNLGKEVFNRAIQQGKISETFELGHLPKGIYFYKIETDEKEWQSGKVLVF